MKYLSIDVGGTFIKYALINYKGEIIEKSKVETPRAESKGTLEDFINILVHIYNKYKSHVEGVAISMPGILDSDTGYLYTSGSIEYASNINLVELLKDKIDVNVTIENDGKCAALAELWCGELSNVEYGAVVVLGTGVGGGIIINGKLHKGSHFSAGEFSYIADGSENTMDLNSYWGMISSVWKLIELVSDKTGIPIKELSGESVFDMVNMGDKKALEALDIYSKNLAIKIYNLQVLLDLDLIAIGGGISQQPLLLEYINKNIDFLIKNNPLRAISPIIPTPKITTCKFFNDSNLIGALYHHLNKKELIKVI